MGIGGAALSILALSLYGYPIRRAVGTAAAIGSLIGVPGTIGFILGGWGDPELPPFSLGFVNLLATLLILPTSMLFAPLGAKAAHALPVRGVETGFRRLPRRDLDQDVRLDPRLSVGAVTLSPRPQPGGSWRGPPPYCCNPPA